MQLLLILALLVPMGPPEGITVTRWMSPDSSKPLSRREWLDNCNRNRTWQTLRLDRGTAPGEFPTGPFFGDRVDILIEDSLVQPLATGIDTMMADLTLEGYEVAAFSITGSSPESLRAFLQAEHDSGLVAAVLIGDLPVAWFQIINDFNGVGANDGYEEFPCELYFMDLDGVWLDSFIQLDSLDSLVPGCDSIFDSHTGDVAPEIGISRLPAAVFARPDTLLPAYLDRAHRYRTGQLVVTNRALVYIDDDWYNAAWRWDQDVGLLYRRRVSIWDRETTRASDYRP